MPERRRLAMMKQLLAVQSAQRSSAEIALRDARKREAQAHVDEQAALTARDEALGDWMRCIAEAGFSPEHSRSLSDRLIERDENADEAGARASAAAEWTSRGEQRWRALEAEVRAGREVQGRLRRKLSRRNEERRLAALADRVTRVWRPS
jgi:hypothetical protein